MSLPALETVRSNIDAFVCGDNSLKELRMVFVRWSQAMALWEFERGGEVVELITKTSHLINEYTSGHWSDKEFRGKLRELVPLQSGRASATLAPWL